MPGGTFFHADKIQPCVDVAWHLAVQKIDDNFSGRRGLPIPRANGSRRHGDNHRRSTFGRVSHLLLGKPFGALVVADHLVEPRLRRLVGRLRAVDRDGSDGAGVNELLDTGALGSSQQIFCAAHVGLINIF